MTKDNTTRSDLIHALSKLTSAQRSIERIDGLRTVKENIQYVIDDVEYALNNVDEDES